VVRSDLPQTNTYSGEIIKSGKAAMHCQFLLFNKKSKESANELFKKRRFTCEIFGNPQSWGQVNQKLTILKIVLTGERSGSKLKEILTGT
jgi:hypothetical protein